jgi:uncharacterized protein (DUF58 family)
LSERRRTFPLIPRRRFAGLYGGTRRSIRRGDGDEVVGTRAYRPGDPVASIDWAVSARLSAARATDEFFVHEYYAAETPRVAVVLDPSPSMALYAPPLPWLDKAKAAEAATELIAASARAAGAAIVGDTRSSSTLSRALELLVHRSSLLPLGSFVFVVSDFVRPLDARRWSMLRARGWDATPVVVQDPTWERSFPAVAGVALPYVAPDGGRVQEAWLSPRAVERRRVENERRFARLLARFRSLGLDPVVLESADPDEVHARFLAWAERRRRLRRRAA